MLMRITFVPIIVLARMRFMVAKILFSQPKLFVFFSLKIYEFFVFKIIDFHRIFDL